MITRQGSHRNAGGDQKNKERLITLSARSLHPGPNGLWRAGQAMAMADTLWAAGPVSQIRGPASMRHGRGCTRFRRSTKTRGGQEKKLSANRNFMGDKQHKINPHINRFRRYISPGTGRAVPTAPARSPEHIMAGPEDTLIPGRTLFFTHFCRTCFFRKGDHPARLGPASSPPL
jgi:hypothetical protein